MKHFVIELTYTVPYEDLEAIRPAHRSFLQTGYDKGWLLMSGPLVPRPGFCGGARAGDGRYRGLLRKRSFPD
jgi:uncharacterized protein YciI